MNPCVHTPGVTSGVPDRPSSATGGNQEVNRVDLFHRLARELPAQAGALGIEERSIADLVENKKR